MDLLLNNLNEVQKKIVKNIKGPLMVLASAGSGKTRVIVYKIAYLIQKGINPFNILSLTFTNKAALEMKHRINTLVGESLANNIWIGTFHSIFARILRIEAPKIGFPSNFTIYDAQDSLNVLKKVIIDLNLNIEVYRAKEIQKKISFYKNNLITVSYYFNNSKYIQENQIIGQPEIGEIYKLYSEKCFKNSAMDFDDLLFKINELFTKYPKVLCKYQDYFRYILVDEYQDTNYLQYLIIKKISSRFQNLCVVGDDAQSIYAFRGANINNILNFKSDYSNSKIIILEQNYRSTQTIVNAANSVINYNKDQFIKNTWTLNPKGEKIDIYQAISDKDEAIFIVNSILNFKKKKNIKNKDFAILYRTNAQSRSLEDILRKKNIDYKVYGGMSFYSRKEVKDLIAYLRILINSNDEESLLRIINFPPRGISNITIKKLVHSSYKKNVTVYTIIKELVKVENFLELSNSIILSLNSFFELIENLKYKLKFYEVYEVAMELVIKSGLINYLKKNNTPESVSKIENIMELIGSIKSFIEEQKNLQNGIPTLNFFIENIILTSDNFNNQIEKNNEDNKISLMTIHLSKGLEFSYVYLSGLEEGLFPSIIFYNTNKKEIEEERRLFYVALTRAKIQVIISFAMQRFRWGKIHENEPSRFLEEIEKKYLNYLNCINKKILNNVKFNSSINKLNGKKSFSLKELQKKTLKNANKMHKYKFKPLSKLEFNKNKSLDINFKIGDSVTHHYFGNGIIVFIEKNELKNQALIKFNNFGEKKILLDFVNLKNH